MRTIVTLDDDSVAHAQELIGVEERSVLLREGLETLIRVESARRLAALGGAEPEVQISSRIRDLGDLTKQSSPIPPSGSTTPVAATCVWCACYTETR